MVPSPIEWLWYWQHGWRVPGFTFNPWIGCEKVSAGCKNCYASVDTYARVSKSRGLPLWGPGSSRHRTSVEYWKGPLRLAEKARELSQIVGFEVRPRVFPSLCDPFEDRIDLLEWRAELCRLIEATPELDWLLLTKRPENVTRMLGICCKTHGLPSNVWLGTSVENQEAADVRIPHLLQVHARVRWLSCEPLLGPLDFVMAKEEQDTLFGSQVVGCNVLAGRVSTRFKDGTVYLDKAVDERRIHWCIVGGESGTNARPMHPDWVRGIQKQCEAAGVPFFMKQWGEYANQSSVDVDTVFVFPDGTVDGKDAPKTTTIDLITRRAAAMRKVGKGNAGRELDGSTWDEQPKVHNA